MMEINNAYKNELIFIAGPCSVESEKQIIEIANALLNQSINFLRGGIWKPRTKPDSFEGVGKIGLQWIKNAGKKIKTPVIVEVATPKHVEECLKESIDAIWLGSRTISNPFSVQAIADVLNGIDIQVMVKNPNSPDLNLWIGAFERLNKAGVKRLYAIHRGFYSFNDSTFRNSPIWDIPLKFQKIYPNIPLICDPSHICGKKETIYFIAQKAIDLLFNGLMVEVHTNPSDALSDAQQQITPKEYEILINNLKINKKGLEDSLKDKSYINSIKKLKKKINLIDKKLIYLLSERMKISKNIGILKDNFNGSHFQYNINEGM